MQRDRNSPLAQCFMACLARSVSSPRSRVSLPHSYATQSGFVSHEGLTRQRSAGPSTSRPPSGCSSTRNAPAPPRCIMDLGSHSRALAPISLSSVSGYGGDRRTSGSRLVEPRHACITIRLSGPVADVLVSVGALCARRSSRASPAVSVALAHSARAAACCASCVRPSTISPGPARCGLFANIAGCKR